MQNSPRRYMVTNTTIKEPRLGSNGKDSRKLQEKNGYVVQFRDEIGNVRMVTPKKWGGNPVMVTNLTEGLYDLYHKGLINIEEIEDISQALKKYTLQPKAAESTPQPVEEPAQEAVREPVKQKASASGMGEVPTDIEKALAYGGGTNPDGKDNFTVVAKKKKHKEF